MKHSFSFAQMPKRYAIMATVLLGLLTITPGAVAQVTSSGQTMQHVEIRSSTADLYKALSEGSRAFSDQKTDVGSLMLDAAAASYVMGILDALKQPYVKPRYKICVPAGMPVKAFMKIVLKFIDNHPKSYGRPPPVVVSAAYMVAFPCRTN